MARVTLRRTDDDLRIFRVNDHLVDLRCLLQPDVRPRLAGIGRFVQAVAGRTANRVARAGIDNAGIGRRYLNGTDAIDVRELIKDRGPRHARVCRFPNAASGCPEIEHAWLPYSAGHSRNSSAVKRADVAPAKTGKEVVARSRIDRDASADCIG